MTAVQPLLMLVRRSGAVVFALGLSISYAFSAGRSLVVPLQ